MPFMCRLLWRPALLPFSKTADGGLRFQFPAARHIIFKYPGSAPNEPNRPSGQSLMKQPLASPLSTDLYELNMVQAYLDRGEDAEAVFEFFVRRLPPRRGFLLAAGLEDVLTY